MGDWGTGNFENDNSRDALASIVGIWETQIGMLLSDQVPPEFADLEFSFGLYACEFLAIPLIEIMIVVTERLDPDYRPSLETVARWRADYLRLFERDSARWDTGPEHLASRRKAIEETFDRLSTALRSNRAT